MVYQYSMKDKNKKEKKTVTGPIYNYVGRSEPTTKKRPYTSVTPTIGDNKGKGKDKSKSKSSNEGKTKKNIPSRSMIQQELAMAGRKPGAKKVGPRAYEGRIKARQFGKSAKNQEKAMEKRGGNKPGTAAAAAIARNKNARKNRPAMLRAAARSRRSRGGGSSSSVA